MAPIRIISLPTTLILVASVVFSVWLLKPPSVGAATAAGECSRVSVSPASKTVRRGGRVLLQGRACSAGYANSDTDAVRVRVKKRKRWTTVARTETDAGGEFAVCVKITVPKGAKVARINATLSTGATGSTRVRVSKKGPGSCLLREDPCTDPDPLLWGNAISAQDPSRHQQFDTGGPSNGPFRRMTVVDGDNQSGERAELGYNSRIGDLGAPWGTFFLYNENARRVTDFWMRLPIDYPISSPKWQVVMQMKQTGPSSNSGGTPVLALEARDARWVLTQSDSPGPSSNTHELWSTPATVETWTPISLDVTYSPDPTKGKIQISVGGVQSPTFTTFTQKYETSPAAEGLTAGGAIPSHLRVGIYHDTSLPGTHLDIANVRVSD